MTNVLVRHREGTQTQREENHVKTEAEVGVMQPNSQNAWGSISWKRQRKILLYRLRREHGLPTP